MATSLTADEATSSDAHNQRQMCRDFAQNGPGKPVEKEKLIQSALESAILAAGMSSLDISSDEEDCVSNNGKDKNSLFIQLHVTSYLMIHRF